MFNVSLIHFCEYFRDSLTAASTVEGQVTSLGRGINPVGRGVSAGKEVPSVPSSKSAFKITSGSSSGNSTLVGESSVGRRDKSSLLWGSTSWSCSLSM